MYFLLFLINFIVSSALTGQDTAICSFVSATNVHSFYTQWNCTADGLPSTPPCNGPVWTGLTCNQSYVVSMSFTDASAVITGTIPPALGSMSTLTALTLNFQSFYGSIPSQLFDITALIYVDFHTNNVDSNYFSSNMTGTVHILLNHHLCIFSM